MSSKREITDYVNDIPMKLSNIHRLANINELLSRVPYLPSTLNEYNYDFSVEKIALEDAERDSERLFKEAEQRFRELELNKTLLVNAQQVTSSSSASQKSPNEEVRIHFQQPESAYNSQNNQVLQVNLPAQTVYTKTNAINHLHHPQHNQQHLQPILTSTNPTLDKYKPQSIPGSPSATTTLQRNSVLHAYASVETIPDSGLSMVSTTAANNAISVNSVTPAVTIAVTAAATTSSITTPFSYPVLPFSTIANSNTNPFVQPSSGYSPAPVHKFNGILQPITQNPFTSDRNGNESASGLRSDLKTNSEFNSKNEPNKSLLNTRINPAEFESSSSSPFDDALLRSIDDKQELSNVFQQVYSTPTTSNYLNSNQN